MVTRDSFCLLKNQNMDRVFDLGYKQFLKKMQKGKFYSHQEISKLILENSIHKPRLERFI
jgi:hypothetical protein